MTRRVACRAFSLVEVAVSLAVTTVLIAVLVPALTSARIASMRETCASNQRNLFGAWDGYLDENKQFPPSRGEPPWHWGGVRHNTVDNQPYIDFNRPINRHLSARSLDSKVAEQWFCCPADFGITDATGLAGTGRRTACQSFGTSYRGNDRLLDARLAGLSDESRGVARNEIVTPPEHMAIMGDGTWFEVMSRTGRLTDWHRTANASNLLFLDGSVRFVSLDPLSRESVTMFYPVYPIPQPLFTSAHEIEFSN